MSTPDQSLQILIDVRSRLDEVVKAQAEFRKMREEVTSTGQAVKTGFGIELARRGLDLLSSTLQESALRAFEMADAIKDGARNLEVSNEAYQVLGNIIRDAGGDAQLLTMAISNSNRSLVEARTLGSAAAGAYRTLGLDIAKLEQLPAERRFELIGRAVLGATDRTQAYSAASQILGARNLPTLLGALKDLATEGWDKLTESQQRAGRIMSDDTITRLEEAKKNIEKLKQSLTIFTGETIGFAGMIGNSFKKDFFGTIKDFLTGGGLNGLGPSLLARVFADNPPLAKPPAPEVNTSAQRELELKTSLANAEYDLAAALQHRQTVEANPNISDFGKKRSEIQLMEQELILRQKLIDATKATPLDATETQQSRDLRIKKLEEQNQQLRDQLLRKRYGTDTFDREQASRDRFENFQSEGGSLQGGLNLGGAARIGAMDFVTGLGTAGEQVSASLESTLGATVHGISDGIHGWLTGTQSFGSAMLQLGDTVFRTFLDTIVQIGVQWLVTQLLVKTGMISTHAVGEGLRAARIAGAAEEGAATTAALAPAAAAASVSSFGLAAVIGLAALLAVMAAFGGFSSGGYTGDVPTHQIAGFVHGQEGVLNASAMRRLGIDNLNRLNTGQPVSVASAPTAFGGTAGAAGGTAHAPALHVYMDRASFVRAMQEDSAGWFREMSAKELRA